MSAALIAGEGLLPLVIAERLASRGEAPVVYALRERPDDIAPHASAVVPVLRMEIKSALADMKMRGVRRVIMAGAVPKALMYDSSIQDEMTRQFVAGLASRDDHTLLGGIVKLFEGVGIEVAGYDDILADMMPSAGRVAGREMTSDEAADVEYGIGIARAVVPLSFGQSVIVFKKSVVAVEAMEGTDAAIMRAGSICKGGSLVKMMKPGQDARYDIPTVGPKTLALMSKAGISCLAIEADRTLIVGREEFDREAERLGIAVTAFEA